MKFFLPSSALRQNLPKKISQQKILTKNFSKKIPPKKFLQKNFSKKIHTKKFPQKFQKKFQKNSKEFWTISPKFKDFENTYLIPYIALKGQKPFRACFTEKSAYFDLKQCNFVCYIRFLSFWNEKLEKKSYISSTFLLLINLLYVCIYQNDELFIMWFTGRTASVHKHSGNAFKHCYWKKNQTSIWKWCKSLAKRKDDKSIIY